MMRRCTVLLNPTWREQGISYLKYLNVCTETLHGTVKECRRQKYVRFSATNYLSQKPDGAGGNELVKNVPASTTDY
ncbi:ATP synthase [Trypanosoma melophagium]|uniref:ATP synthase n=1 Tax=Trypanosoma melophagium TaxID=715481 RepID=UPI00351A0AF7|nr:ATP synthase [Trypanosoma melophagium]